MLIITLKKKLRPEIIKKNWPTTNIWLPTPAIDRTKKHLSILKLITRMYKIY